MNIQKKSNAFTLIELLVAIAIMTILLLGINGMDFNRLSAKQELEILTNKIKTNHEEIRNNSLSGKGIGINSIVPDFWQIDFSLAGSGKIINYYSSGGILYPFDHDIVFKKGLHITKLDCVSINNNKDQIPKTGPLSTTGSIIYEGGNITLSGACDTSSSSKHRSIEITIENLKKDKKILNINMLNGLAEIIKN